MTTFSVPDMSCGHCKAAIEKAVKAVDPAAAVTVDLAARTVEISSSASDAALAAAMAAEGYPSEVRG